MSLHLSNQKIVESMEARGYVILKDFFGRDVIAGVRRELERWVGRHAKEMVRQGLADELYEDEPFETRFAKLHANCPEKAPAALRLQLHWPGMYPLFFHSALLDIVEQILGPEIRLYPNYTVRLKLPDHAPTQVLWHQDAGYTASGQHGQDPGAADLAVQTLRMVNVWAPLVPARVDNGCMKFIPGTHKLGTVAHEAKQFYLEIVRKELEPRLNNAVDVIVDPRDVVLFSNLLFHMGQPNRCDMVRWSCDWRYQDATQSTLREHHGHIARSRGHPANQVRSAEQWANLSFV